MFSHAGERSNPDLPAIEGHHYNHDDAFESWIFESQRPLWLVIFQELSKHLPPVLVRSKGFLSAAEKLQRRYLLQLVGRMATLLENGSWNQGHRRPGRCLSPAGQRELCRH